MVTFPPGEPQDVCALCSNPFEVYAAECASAYANLVCQSCDERATTSSGGDPAVGREYLQRESDEPIDSAVVADVGDNPVFVDGRQCWRRYKFGGWVTRLDEHDCESVAEFRRTHRDDV